MIAASVATKTVECLRFSPETFRAAEVLRALGRGAPGAGVTVEQTSEYVGKSEWLLLWGPGAPNRFGPMRQQLERGGHVLACDCAYWERDRKFRISIDGAHPQRWVLKQPLSASRFTADGITVVDAWDPTGPVIIAGIGEKASVQYGAAVPAWEAAMLRAATESGRRVLYRPKKNGPAPAGVSLAGNGPIEQVLRGASALITWHSNVAVDAIRMGIPVVCKDGAAAACCTSEWADDLRPLTAEWRDRFLGNLAWFQWSPNEASACWAFLRELLA